MFTSFPLLSKLNPFISADVRGINPQFLQTLWKLQKIILNTLDFDHVTQKVCDALLEELDFSRLGYRIVVLSLISDDKKNLKRVAFSQTEEAKVAVGKLPIRFNEINVPLSDKNNLMVQTLKTKQASLTHTWHDLMRPMISQLDAERVQKEVGIKSSVVYPLIVNDEVIGTMIFSLAKNIKTIQNEETQLLSGFVDIVAMSVQNANLYRKLKKSRDNLKTVNQRLTELDKLKDEFVSLASHELRTPMVSIRNYTWMLLNGKAGPLKPKQREYVRRVYESGTRLSRLVNSMLNISRIESGRIILNVERVNLLHLIESVLTEVDARAEKQGIKIMVNKSAVNLATGKELSKLPSVMIDSDKIKEVIINLVGNSMKFTKPGGDITISFAVDELYVHVQVTDSGIGLTQDEIPQLFKKFGMIKETYLMTTGIVQGTGLGLYICKSIIEMHGGTIGVDSQGRGKGSTFYFTVPRLNSDLAEHLKHNGTTSIDAGIIHTDVSGY